VDEIAVYRTIRPRDATEKLRKLLLKKEVDIIAFTSSSTVSSFASALKGRDMSRLPFKVACIGPKTAETALRAGLNVDIVAERYTIVGLVEAIENHLEKEA
jgi:uroporphyrinogen III methyltransferase/synthase